MQYIVGQRWASHAEPQLGLGIISESSHRRVTVTFPAAAESRVYATDNAPLSRVKYSVDDQVQDADENTFTITHVEEMAGIINYHVVDEAESKSQLHEIDLNCFIQFTTPKQRLFGGHIDRNSAFKLRVQTLEHSNRLSTSTVNGLLGSRTSLLPHQIYIANEVSKRHQPRVLLADEVGLGKTIEAGMILHQQIHTGKVAKVLILVPNALVHQWLVEMLRRFNLRFSIFDLERVQAIEESGYENPFDSEQRILADIDFITQYSDVKANALATDWDMIIVDEAHHLHWEEGNPSEQYQFIEQLAANTKSLLLLSATPEQAGIEGHFARLKLLDPERFYDLEKFKQEEAGYQALHDLIQDLLDHQGDLSKAQQQTLETFLGEPIAADHDKNTIINQLLDHHGTSRVLMRNTRAAHQGFPERVLNSYPLDCPEIYQGKNDTLEQALFPETAHDEALWIANDPRVEWLAKQLKTLKHEKVLVICHNAATAQALDHHFNLYAGIRSCSFYEGLSILERDRAAAYFAETDNGAQVLVCSEIGSEGRNFQFAHHLVLFDLPLNPDLIEQRIGRLDRIGQTHPIQIHVPYLLNTAQENLFRWCHEGLNLFQQSCQAGYAIFEHFQQRLETALLSSGETLDALLEDTSNYANQVAKELEKGRDRLLELNSCRKDIANGLIATIENEEDNASLAEYMEAIFDEYGIDQEEHSEHTLLVRPSNEMQGQHFPWLQEDGNTITFSREKALSREDMDFLSWEHPMVTEAMDMILNSEHGNTAIASMQVRGIPKGGYLLETIYGIDITAPKALQLSEFLPISPQRLLIDNEGKNYANSVSHEKLNELTKPVKLKIAQSITSQLRDSLEGLLNRTQASADKLLETTKADALAKLSAKLEPEIKRLEALKKINPNVRQDEIDFLVNRLELSKELINKAAFNLQAVRVVVNT